MHCARKTVTCARSSAGRNARPTSAGSAPRSSQGDVTDQVSLAAIDGCTHVVHLVGIIQGRREFHEVMTVGTENLIRP